MSFLSNASKVSYNYLDNLTWPKGKYISCFTLFFKVTFHMVINVNFTHMTCEIVCSSVHLKPSLEWPRLWYLHSLDL